jgi:transcriptional regulator with XRE-family HTH domain
VERLLSAGTLSQRKIAKMVGISRAVVGAIAAGTRPDYEALRRERQENEPERLGPLGRCPGCGGLVYAPCRLCRVRRVKDRERQLVREARRRARLEALRQLLHKLREQSLRGDGPRPATRRMVS